MKGGTGLNSERTIFSQLLDFLSFFEFRKCVERYMGNYKVQSFSCRDQFLCMAFVQLTYRRSLRDIEACLRVAQSKLYHMGIRGSVSRNTLAHLFKCRWQIELFFKWIKQHLRIKSFYGMSENAVKTQIWIAISVYALVAIVKKQLKSDLNLYTILQIFSVSLFEKMPILQALIKNTSGKQNVLVSNQLNLFD